METILITGANRGLGLEAVRQYCVAGWRVIACCRKPEKAEKLQALKEHFNQQLVIFQLDVNIKASQSALSQKLNNQPIDVLLNIAGIWGPKNRKFGQLETEDWLETFRTNVVAPLLLSQTLIENIRSGKRKIIATISSNMGSVTLNTEGGEYIYRSSKAALNAALKSLSIDLKPEKITIIALHPGWVKTDMGGENAPLNVEESINGVRNILEHVTFEDSGKFIAHDGQELPW